MTTKVHYICDHCEATQYTNEQFWTVELRVARHGYPPGATSQRSIEVCRRCLEDFGLAPSERKPPALPPAPTIESLFREILAIAGEAE